jgi:TRAP-type mannitol/chloroaromatic compound transport system permease small subunit
MERSLRTLVKIIKIIDPIAIWSGNLVGWLIIPLVFGLTYEVVARYVFNAPTIWAFDITYMLYASLGMLGAGYTLYKNGHIRTDIFYDHWSPRRQGWVDIICYVFLFFPGMFFFFLAGLNIAIHSWKILETSDASPWRPPLYPLKTVIPVSALLILIQGFSELLKSIYAVLKGERL